MVTIEWKNGKIRFLDQTKLPIVEKYVVTNDEQVIAKAIKSLALRGAPLIGIAAAYGFVLAFNKLKSKKSLSAYLETVAELFGSTRPTAVNLFWAIDQMRDVVFLHQDDSIVNIQKALLNKAVEIHLEDERNCKAIGEFGAGLICKNSTILTHCNAGALATGGIGTAIGVIQTAWEQGKINHVYIDETRPLLQGARLTAWELKKLGIPSTLITDNTSAFLMQQKKIDAIVVGADRITRNGDTANKIGTYGLAVLANYHNIPFYVAAPTSTVDLNKESGKDIPIEERNSIETTNIGKTVIAPAGINVYSPAFDITPSHLITAIITENYITAYPYNMASWCNWRDTADSKPVT